MAFTLKGFVKTENLFVLTQPKFYDQVPTSLLHKVNKAINRAIMMLTFQ